ncbi:MAG TPA: winged helix-turn-helix domain-containing protein [Caulobacteraceae bacterium]|jgi:DNA-binding winged helix-turn-helix (wHTH) protein|nr:winged helix-turn-helix domain-containing protein [Caulobacteraceae bacterium]
MPATVLDRPPPTSHARVLDVEVLDAEPQGGWAGHAAAPVRLAREADFRLGGLKVRPSLCEVEAHGRRRRLEPRVMQVLVALARADGRVVSRDGLIESCWGGRIVSEDAINRCIGKLRRLAEAFDGGYAIETVPRIGYRLNRLGLRAEPSVRPWQDGPSLRAALALGVAALLVLIGRRSPSQALRGH